MKSERMMELEALERLHKRTSPFPMRTIRPMWKPSIQGRSLDTFDYHSGGQRPLPSINLNWQIDSKIGSLDNALHIPGGGQNYIFHQDLHWQANSKVGSLDNIDFTLRKTSFLPKNTSFLPKIGKVYYGVKAQKSPSDAVHYELADPVSIVPSRKYQHVKAKVGSLDNIQYSPRGGDLKVHDETIVWNAQSKIGSLENSDHIAGGGNVNIRDDKLNWNVNSKIGSLDNATYVPRQSSFKLKQKELNWTKKSKVGSLDNRQHQAGGGDVKILNEKPHWKAKAKIGSIKAAREYDNASPYDRHRYDIKTPLYLL